LSLSDDTKRHEDSRKATPREKIYTYSILAVVIICLVLLILHPFVKIAGGNLTSFDTDANIGWTYDNGDPADLTSLKFAGGKGIVKRDITSVFTAGKDLCFETSNLFFKVYLNDEQIYEFHPDIPFYYGKYYGDYTHFVNIPYFKGMGHLRIEYEALTINNWSNFRDTRLTEGNDYLREGVGAGIFEFALCFSSCIIGVIIIIMGVVFHTRRNGMLETVSLGALAILVACFLMSSTKIWQLLFMDSALPRLSEYIALALLPVPVVLFVSAYTEKLEKKLPVVICFTSFSLFALIVLSLVTGIIDFSALLMAIHTNIIITMILLSAFFLSSVHKKEISTVRRNSLILAFVILIITGSIDMVMYYVKQGSYTIHTVNYGLAAFIIIVAIYEIKNIMDINKKNTEADAMFRLARVDGLTGLANRLAFDEAEKELADDDSSRASFTLLDINYLKTVNDRYGHSEGDRHIKAAANIIAESFGKYGKCFRIGGDEFFAIIKGEDHEKKVIRATQEMTEAITQYNRDVNPPIPLHIACGTASFESGINTIGETEKLADSRMYLHKKRIKEADVAVGI